MFHVRPTKAVKCPIDRQSCRQTDNRQSCRNSLSNSTQRVYSGKVVCLQLKPRTQESWAKTYFRPPSLDLQTSQWPTGSASNLASNGWGSGRTSQQVENFWEHWKITSNRCCHLKNYWHSVCHLLSHTDWNTLCKVLNIKQTCKCSCSTSTFSPLLYSIKLL